MENKSNILELIKFSAKLKILDLLLFLPLKAEAPELKTIHKDIFSIECKIDYSQNILEQYYFQKLYFPKEFYEKY